MTGKGAAGDGREDGGRASERTATAAPQRNFDLPPEERVRALVGGPPAFTRRLRAIEDLEAAIVHGFEQAQRACVRPIDPSRLLATHERLRTLVEAHNRFYPIEANLRISLRTGELLDRDGTAWQPRRCPSIDELMARAAGEPARVAPGRHRA